LALSGSCTRDTSSNLSREALALGSPNVTQQP
jgi:hypothetical protein